MILSKKLVLLATTLVFLTSCKEDSESRATLDIAGKWEYVVSYSNGYEQQMLNVQKDSSIIISWSLYGVQPNTTPDQLNATIDYYGELDIVQPQVEFNVTNISTTITILKLDRIRWRITRFFLKIVCMRLMVTP